MDLDGLMRNVGVVGRRVKSLPIGTQYHLEVSGGGYRCLVLQTVSPGIMLLSAKGGSFGFSLAVIYGMAARSAAPGDRMIIYGDDRFEESDISLAVLAEGAEPPMREYLEAAGIDGSKIIDGGHARSIVDSFLARF